MKASELRIGNHVTISRTEIIMEAGDFRFEDSYFNPIPITEHWLFLFGFEFHPGYKNYIVRAGEYKNSIKQYRKGWIYNIDLSDASCYSVAEIKYVHQLQNLYFAINNEEL